MYGACFACLWVSGIGPLRLVPVFVYAALLADVGLTFIEAHLVRRSVNECVSGGG